MTGIGVTWDGYNLVVVQMFLGALRVHGEPPYRVPDGDFAKLQVWEGTWGGDEPDGGWVTITPGTVITVDGDDISLIGGVPLEEAD